MSEQVDKMTQAEREALFARVAGIQSLIDRGGTDGEIASAMAAMRRILTKYNLDESTLGGMKPNKNKVTHDWVSFSTERRTFSWEETIASVIAESYYCGCMKTDARSHKTGKPIVRRLLFVGRAMDVQITKLVFIAVRTRVIQLANERIKYYTGLLRDKGINASEIKGENSIRTMRLSYLSGMVMSIEKRLQIASEREETEESTALILVRKDEITEYLGRTPTPESREITNYNQEMYDLGALDGSKIDLNAPDQPKDQLLALPDPDNKEKK